MIQKLHIGTTIAALVLFFLPWIDIQCSNRSFATQTGIQTIYGGSSVTGDAKALQDEQRRNRPRGDKGDESIDEAPLVGLAFFAVIAAVISSFLPFRSGNEYRQQRVGILCAAALMLLTLQVLYGFPAKRALERSRADTATSEYSRDPVDGLGAGLAAAMMLNIEVRYLPAFFIELVMLGLPTLVLANGVIDKMKRA